jgi:hypothetical protein
MHIALVSEMDAGHLAFDELATVSAALSKQVSQDFAPLWGVNATVDPFTSLEKVPPGYWPVIIKDDINDDDAGYHTDKNGNPLALVQYAPNWSLVASHEVLEMLADPFGNRVISAVSPVDDQSRVEILVEVCDPCERAKFGYQVNGVLVSDFYTPRYFDPVTTPGTRYGFTDNIKKAREVLDGGYLSFHDLTTDHWMRLENHDSQLNVVDLGIITANQGLSMRCQIDRLANGRKSRKVAAKTGKVASKTKARRKAMTACSNAKAEMWRTHISGLESAKKS